MIPKQPDTAWFTRARFGMFIHWGLYALPGGVWKGEEAEYVGEWLQARFRIPNAEYGALAKSFNPTRFDADAWVRAAVDAGMEYLVFTSKHHDGFAMFRTKVSAFNVVDATPWGRDPLAELAEACRRHGIRLGIYYSHNLDWHEADAGDPGPKAGKNYGMSWGNDWDFPELAGKRFERYFESKAYPQVEELCTQYGDVSTFWFDCAGGIPRACSERLLSLIRERQPACLVNTRLGHGLGDYGSLGDNQLAGAAAARPRETPATLNDTWGFKWHDHRWKHPREVAAMLAACASKNVNYLLNIGPRPDGAFPDAALDILRETGKWVRACRDAVKGNEPDPFPSDNPWGPCTMQPGDSQRGTRLFFTLVHKTPSRVSLAGLDETVASVRLRHAEAGVEGGEKLQFNSERLAGGVSHLSVDLPLRTKGGLPALMEVELATRGFPSIDRRLLPQQGVLRLDATVGHATGAAADRAEQMDVDGIFQRPAAGDRIQNGLWVDAPARGAVLAWRALVLESGTYAARLRLRSRRHGAPWVDGMSLNLTVVRGANRKQVAFAIKQEKLVDGGPFLAALCPMGDLDLISGMEYDFILEGMGGAPAGADAFGVEALVIEPKHS